MITLSGLALRLGQAAGGELLRGAAQQAAEALAEGVRSRLSGGPGGAHEAPWLQTGALRDSVGAVVEGDGLRAVVGSSSRAAVPQELGTVHMPARPFLAPVAAEMGQGLAEGVRDAVAQRLRAGADEGA